MHKVEKKAATNQGVANQTHFALQDSRLFAAIFISCLCSAPFIPKFKPRLKIITGFYDRVMLILIDCQD